MTTVHKKTKKLRKNIRNKTKKNRKTFGSRKTRFGKYGRKIRKIYKSNSSNKTPVKHKKIKNSGKYPMSRGNLFFLNKKSTGKRITAKLVRKHPKAFSEKLRKKYL